MRVAVRSLVIVICLCGPALSQSTETVLYNFGAYATDGTFPQGGLLFDSVGNIYGATSGGGAYCQGNGGCGTVYELSPTMGLGWTETILYNFCPTGGGCPDGFTPYAGLIADSLGNLYGTTTSGGKGGVGTVFRLSAPSNGSGRWNYTVLWSFAKSLTNGNSPGYGKLNMDPSGNIYGTTTRGGSKDLGVIFELSPVGDGTYHFAILHNFSGADGALPAYGVAIDTAGNLYGTTQYGGTGGSICTGHPGGCGLVYELSSSTGTWQERILYKFDGVIGAYPVSPISIDQFGNLYGTFTVGGGGTCFLGTCGGVFKLALHADGGKKYAFNFNGGQADGNPQNGVLVTAENTVYGSVGVLRGGNVYKLNYEHETILYNFCSLANCADGSAPTYGTIVSHQGVLYGGTGLGGIYGVGTVYSLSK